MNFLEERIVKDGQVRDGNILKVDSFLNHQLDCDLLNQIGNAFYQYFKHKKITRILTVEASGIAIACAAAPYFHVPVVFAKKSKSQNLDGDLYTSVVHSYTHNTDNTIVLSKKYLTEADHVLLVDDFLANGKAMMGLIDICYQAKAHVEGIGIAIEKGFQDGGHILRQKGYDVYSLAIIESMSEKGIVFSNHNESEKKYSLDEKIAETLETDKKEEMSTADMIKTMQELKQLSNLDLDKYFK